MLTKTLVLVVAASLAVLVCLSTDNSVSAGGIGQALGLRGSNIKADENANFQPTLRSEDDDEDNALREGKEDSESRELSGNRLSGGSGVDNNEDDDVEIDYEKYPPIDSSFG